LEESQMLSGRSILKNALLVLGSCVLALLLMEGALRILKLPAPKAASVPGSVAPVNGESPFLYSGTIGYEPRPNARILVTSSDRPEPFVEKLNQDGFRGRDVTIPKQAGTFRILALGDSVVQGFSVSEERTWERVLERALRARSRREDVHYEVVNAGVGGYVSWQVGKRLMSRGLKYQPDMVILLAGLNDLSFSTRSEWRPGLTLADIEQAYTGRISSAGRQRFRDRLYQRSRVAAVIRDVRNTRWNAQRVEDVIRKKQLPSGLAFNEKALGEYVRNVASILEACQAAKAQLAVVLFPVLPTPELVSDHEMLLKMLAFLDSFPIGAPDFVAWQRRYLQALREFGAAHAEVTLIDAYGAFQKLSREERLAAFTDQVHLSVRGNEILGETALRALEEAGWLPKP
jgi:lysophospholipase L1-like esterase